MTMLNETIEAPDGSRFGLYVSRPDKPNGRAIVVLQEIFGVNSAVRALADQYAQAGYLAVAPDLFWRFGPGIELDYSRADTLKAMELMKGYNVADGVVDSLATISFLRSQADIGKVASLGLCLGGLLSFLVGVKGDCDAAVSFYATDIVKALGRLPQCTVPLSIHYGGADRFIPAANVAAVRLAVEGQAKGAVFVYPGAEHGFYTRGIEADRTLAHERVLGFLDMALRTER